MDFVLQALQTRRELEAHAALAPFSVFRNYIFGDKSNRHGPANEFELFRTGFRRYKRKVRGTVGRSDSYKTAIGLNARIKDQLEAKLIQIETKALLEIAHENRNGLESQVRVLAVQANRGAVGPLS